MNAWFPTTMIKLVRGGQTSQSRQLEEQARAACAALSRILAMSGGNVLHRRLNPAWRVLAARALVLFSITSLTLAGAFAATPQAIAVKQAEPGVVTVTVRTPGATPQANAFTLQVPNAGAEPKRYTAESVTPADALSPALAATVLLAVDRSGSMHAVVPGIKAALKDVLATPRPDLRIAVMSFGSDTPLPTPFYTEPADVLRAVDEIRAETGPDGKTRLFDAISMGMSYLANDSSHGPKRLIVITDGKDEGSRTTFDGLAEQLKGRSQPLNTIAFGQTTARSSGQLETLANDASGAFVQARSADILAASIRDDLGTSPAPAFDVSFHYPAANGAPPVNNAQLEYAGQGGPPVLMPIRVALAAPAVPPPPSTSTPEVVSDSHAGQASTPDAASGSRSVFGSLFKSLFEKININIGLSLLMAAGGAGAFYLVYRYVIVVYVIRVPPDPETPKPPGPKTPRPATQIGVMFPPPSPGRPSALLVSEGPRRAPLSYAIEKPNVQVGADPDSDFVLHDDYASRQHAAIRFESGSLYLTDLGSSNGTFLNGTRVKRVMVLSPGDQIRFGRTTWELRRAGEAKNVARSAGERFERPVP